MGGFEALYACHLEPVLFDCCIPINPVYYMDSNMWNLLLFVFGMWYENGKIKSHFDIPDGTNWKEIVGHHYKKESFFKKFDHTVMDNMIEDELNDEIRNNPGGKYKTIDLNTLAQQEYICYYSAQHFISSGMKCFDKITTPVYHIVPDKDTAGDMAIQTTRAALKSVIEPIDLENSTHLVIGENPDLVVNELIKVIDQNIHNHERDGDLRYAERKLQEKYGTDYRNIIMNKEFDAYLDSENAAKL